ncbi:MAG: hypothetical protein VW879_04310 [Opitutae bacterium]
MSSAILGMAGILSLAITVGDSKIDNRIKLVVEPKLKEFKKEVYAKIDSTEDRQRETSLRALQESIKIKLILEATTSKEVLDRADRESHQLVKDFRETLK